MPILDNRIDINKKYPVPSGIKLILLIAVILGIYLRSCYHKEQNKKIIFQNAKITAFTNANIDVEFEVINKTGIEGNKPVLIRIINKQGLEVASKITRIYLKNDGKVHAYLVEITKIKNPIKSLDEIGIIVVKLYNPSIL